jgi:hypothetical protein
MTDRSSTNARAILTLLARACAVGALLVVAAAYSYGVWRAAAYAWGMGLRFYQSTTITPEAVRAGAHCFLLGIAVLLAPRRAGVGFPRLREGGWALWGYGSLIAVAAAAVAANHLHPFFTSPFAGRGPLFFTLGPLAWELMWPGLVYGFATAVMGERASPAGPHILVVLLALAGAAWYLPEIVAMRPYDKIGFVAVTLAINFLSLTLRRRTGSIWPGFAGHLLVKFFLTW